MRTLYFSGVFILLLLGSAKIRAQECGTEMLHRSLMEHDPEYAKAFLERAKAWADHAMSKNRSAQKVIGSGKNAIYEIPVIFHVMHRGEPVGSLYNPSDTQLLSLLDYVNKAFAATWPTYPDTINGGARARIRFVPALRDPNCKPINGIHRFDASVIPKYAQYGVTPDQNNPGNGIRYRDMVKYVLWPMDDYYNIFIVHEVEDLGSVVGAFAFYPGPIYDGTVMEAKYAKAGEMVLVHELGHAFDLRHTFEGDNNDLVCPPDNNCLIDGDGICDTEPHKRSYIGCYNEINPCTGKPGNFVGRNFMSYSRICNDRFTREQVDRMEFVVGNSTERVHLLHSDAVLPPLNIVLPDCIPDNSNYDTANATFAGFSTLDIGNIYSYDFNNTSYRYSVYSGLSCKANTVLYAGRTYTMKVTSVSPLQHIRTYIDYNNDGKFQEPQELVAYDTVQSGVYTDNIYIPFTGVVMCKYLRLRIVTERASEPAPNTCTNVKMGQVKDYAVYISPPPQGHISIKQTAGINPTCVDSLIAFTATVMGGSPGYKILWDVNYKKTIGGPVFSYTDHFKYSTAQAVLLSENHVCKGSIDSVFSNIDTIYHIQPNKPPYISKHGDTIVSDVYPVHWYHVDSGLVTANANTGILPVWTGNYYAVDVRTGCPSTPSNYVFSYPVSVQEQTDDIATILFPNPATGRCTFVAGSNKSFTKILVTNSVGQVAAQHNEFSGRIQLDVTQWQAGLYIATVTYSNGQQEKYKLVVAR